MKKVKQWYVECYNPKGGGFAGVYHVKNISEINEPVSESQMRDLMQKYIDNNDDLRGNLIREIITANQHYEEDNNRYEALGFLSASLRY